MREGRTDEGCIELKCGVTEQTSYSAYEQKLSGTEVITAEKVASEFLQNSIQSQGETS